MYLLLDNADSKNWNLEGHYLSARIAFRIPKEAEQYCKRVTLAPKKKKVKEQQQRGKRPARHVRQHLLQNLYLLYRRQNQYLLQNPDLNRMGRRNLQAKFQQVQVQRKQCLRMLKASDCMYVDECYHN